MFPGMPSLSASAGGGGPSGVTSNNGLSTQLDTGFNFDASGWVVNVDTTGTTTSASGNKDANGSNQAASTPLPGVLGSSSAGGSGMLLLVAAGAALWFFMK